MSDGQTKVRPATCRVGEKVIRNGQTRQIVYLPLEAKGVSVLMEALVTWIIENQEMACPLKAGIAQYQFATIHLYYDGNGRNTHLLTTLIFHQRGYDLKGIYSLEKYYAHHRPACYGALAVALPIPITWDQLPQILLHG